MEMTEIYRNDLIYSISYALDYVERDLVTVSTHHSQRVALISASMGRAIGYPNDYLLNLAVCAALHDNALTEYGQRAALSGDAVTPDSFENDLAGHCTMGEKNISSLAFYSTVKGAILYHHERADGLGPFGLTTPDVPIFARLIHLADNVDAQFDLSEMSEGKYLKVREYVKSGTGTLFDKGTASAFLGAFSSPEKLYLRTDTLNDRLRSELPEEKSQYSPASLIVLAGIFSKIIDCKSPFTSRHSGGIAEKAGRIGEYYGWDADTQAKLYLAGALHDVGKLMVKSDILEKPGKLTDEEYRAIQDHAYGSYLVLSSIRGMEDISHWAYMHHEKLDGSGYPFGINAEALGEKERLLQCLDIYQAMREERPYKSALDHESAMQELTAMVRQGKLDGHIVRDIGICFAPDDAVLAAG